MQYINILRSIAIDNKYTKTYIKIVTSEPNHNSSYYDTKKFYYSFDNTTWNQILINADKGETLKSKLMEMFSCSYQVFAKYSNTGNSVRAGTAKGIYFKVE